MGHLEICAVGVLLTLQFVNYLNNLKSVRYQTNNSIQRFAEFLSIGAELQKNGQLYQAQSIYRQVLTLDPTCPPARYRLGVLHFIMGETDLAIKLLDSALVIEPDNGIYCLTLAKVLLLGDRIDEAEPAFCRGLSIVMNIEPYNLENQSSFRGLPSLYESLVRQSLKCL